MPGDLSAAEIPPAATTSNMAVLRRILHFMATGTIALHPVEAFNQGRSELKDGSIC
jgi:hypothetical protein